MQKGDPTISIRHASLQGPNNTLKVRGLKGERMYIGMEVWWLPQEKFLRSRPLRTSGNAPFNNYLVSYLASHIGILL